MRGPVQQKHKKETELKVFPLIAKIRFSIFSSGFLYCNQIGFGICLLCRGMPDIQWMNLDPVKLMEELSQFTSLEGFKEMLDKAQVRDAKNHTHSMTKKTFSAF